MKKDRIQYGDELASGEREAIIQRATGETVHGLVGDLKDGHPIPFGADVIETASEADADGWHDVSTLYKSPLNGPPQVATPAYRAGYDRIFGKQKVGEA